MCSGSGRIVNAVDDNVPKSFARSFIDTSYVDNIYPETFWKSNLPSPETRTLSYPPSL